MSQRLAAIMAGELARPTPPEVQAFAGELAARRGAAAVLFYGSALRTGALDGVLDFYLLTETPHRRGFHGAVERRLWPEVSYHELTVGALILRAKVATMTLADFQAAARGERLDTTIWARFVQPAALVWSRDAASAARAGAGVAAAVTTAARFAAALGPVRGLPADYWTALFRQTYAAEFRVEAPGREGSIMAFDAERYDRLLPLAWRAAGLSFETDGDVVSPCGESLGALRRAWRTRRGLGKPLNIARLIKAAFTFEGAAGYAAWKIERHTGVAIPVTPFRERHPILSAPGALWRLWRARPFPLQVESLEADKKGLSSKL